MKIDLDQQLILDPVSEQKIRLGAVIEESLFKSRNIKSAREIYDKVKGNSEADLNVEEMADIQKASREAGVMSGVQWQLEDIFNNNKKGE